MTVYTECDFRQFHNLPTNVEKKFRKTYYEYIEYSDIIMTFDTETTSLFQVNNKWVSGEFYDNKKCTAQYGTCYLWQFYINGLTFFGRHLSELDTFFTHLNNVIPSRKVIYIHNLSFEFQFLRSWLKGNISVFARKERIPIYAFFEKYNIEFRCSYMLTNMSLEVAAAEYDTPHCKAVGNLDYRKIRTSITPISSNELYYAEMDVIVLAEIIEVFKKRYTHISKIPLTQTGEVRRVVKREVLNSRQHLAAMKKLVPSLDFYKILTRVIAGGYTHANYLYVGEVIAEAVASYDFNSSYPYVMCTERFPCTPFENVPRETILDTMHYCYIGLIEIHNIHSKSSWNYISRSKVDEIKGGVIDNGRIVSADYIKMYVTEVDLEIILKNYHIKEWEWVYLYQSVKKYLPIKFVLYVLELFAHKTSLKGIPERADFYMKMKQFLNSLFGMCLTSSVNPEVIYNGEWDTRPLDDDKIAELLNQEKPFLSFAWGVYITAYARRNLWDVISVISGDAIYSDTDSVKFLNVENNLPHIEEYNKRVIEKIQRVCADRSIDFDKFAPNDIKGRQRILGQMECDGNYTSFKTLGAKKYAYVEDGDFHFVVSGCKKKYVTLDENGEAVYHSVINGMEDFDIGKVYDNGRTSVWYIDNQEPLAVTDYLGNTMLCTDPSGVAIANTTYSMGISDEFSDFLEGHTTNKYNSPFRLSM